jgi:hypothetical protein
MEPERTKLTTELDSRWYFSGKAKAAAIAAFLGGLGVWEFVCKAMLQLGHENEPESAAMGAATPRHNGFQRRADTDRRNACGYPDG